MKHRTLDPYVHRSVENRDTKFLKLPPIHKKYFQNKVEKTQEPTVSNFILLFYVDNRYRKQLIVEVYYCTMSSVN